MEPLKWWQKGIVYQIYPRSFQDSNGDGLGDLNGIYRRLDYLESLNIQAVWLSPIYPSPMKDFGYDVADYTAIHPPFGSLEDFDRLLAEMHRRGLKLILDLVPNHTSDEHAWFLESRSSRDNPKRDWYIWRDPAPDGGPPNNWLSHFGGSAWEFDELTGQYYLHLFVTGQPDLNYRNPEVMAAIQDVMRFWLERGVDGFRVDVIWLLLKDELFRDNPKDKDGREVRLHNQNLPGVHELIRKLRAVVDDYPERVMIGEIYEPVDVLAQYYGKGDECHLPFNFTLITSPWQAEVIQKHIKAYEAALPEGAWPNYVLGNHDQHRIATRVGRAGARTAAMLLMTLRGTPTWYYGDEIGMTDVSIPPELVRDPPAVLQPEIAHIVGRDPERTPMQWDSSPNAGFCGAGVRPWLPVADDYKAVNVMRQESDPDSMLSYFKALTALRQREPALHAGQIEVLELPAGAQDVLAYLRAGQSGDRLLIVLNLAQEAVNLDLKAVLAERSSSQAEIMMATGAEAGETDLARLELQAHQGLILRLS